MIEYSSGYWSVALIFQSRGSVFPKALIWAIPSGVLSLVFEYVYHYWLENHSIEDGSRLSMIWSSFTFVLGFLVVFRTQQAYNRYWQGVMLLRQARGEWFSAYSSAIAFCSTAAEKRRPVEIWQHTLARLFSMLNCLALQSVADMELGNAFEHLDTTGFDDSGLIFLINKSDAYIQMEIMIQWIQRHIVHGSEIGVLPIPPPILSRAFQELSRGAVNFNQLRNFTEIPFPFPYAQLLSAMLCLFTIITPCLTGVFLHSGGWGALLSCLGVLAFTGVNYIAIEIESPFGSDLNDLPLNKMQQDVNASLWQLLDRRAQSPPSFAFDKNYHRQARISRTALGAGGRCSRLSGRSSPPPTLLKLDTTMTLPSSPSLGTLDDDLIPADSSRSNRSDASSLSTISKKKRKHRREPKHYATSSPPPMDKLFGDDDADLDDITKSGVPILPLGPSPAAHKTTSNSTPVSHRMEALQPLPEVIPYASEKSSTERYRLMTGASSFTTSDDGLVRM